MTDTQESYYCQLRGGRFLCREYTKDSKYKAFERSKAIFIDEIGRLEIEPSLPSEPLPIELSSSSSSSSCSSSSSSSSCSEETAVHFFNKEMEITQSFAPYEFIDTAKYLPPCWRSDYQWFMEKFLGLLRKETPEKTEKVVKKLRDYFNTRYDKIMYAFAAPYLTGAERTSRVRWRDYMEEDDLIENLITFLTFEGDTSAPNLETIQTMSKLLSEDVIAALTSIVRYLTFRIGGFSSTAFICPRFPYSKKVADSILKDTEMFHLVPDEKNPGQMKSIPKYEIYYGMLVDPQSPIFRRIRDNIPLTPENFKEYLNLKYLEPINYFANGQNIGKRMAFGSWTKKQLRDGIKELDIGSGAFLLDMAKGIRRINRTKDFYVALYAKHHGISLN